MLILFKCTSVGLMTVAKCYDWRIVLRPRHDKFRLVASATKRCINPVRFLEVERDDDNHCLPFRCELEDIPNRGYPKIWPSGMPQDWSRLMMCGMVFLRVSVMSDTRWWPEIGFHWPPPWRRPSADHKRYGKTRMVGRLRAHPVAVHQVVVSNRVV